MVNERSKILVKLMKMYKIVDVVANQCPSCIGLEDNPNCAPVERPACLDCWKWALEKELNIKKDEEED